MDEQYPYMDTVVSGLGLEFIDRKNMLLDSWRYIAKNAKKIDVLNLYHWGRRTLLNGLLYKTLHPSGKLYVKLDMDFRAIDILKRNPRARFVLKAIVRISNLVTVESTAIQKQLFKLISDKIAYLPNGFQQVTNNEDTVINKEKMILTVGRLGTQQKATEILLQSFAGIADDIPEWKLVLVGGIEDEFRAVIHNFYAEYPKLEHRVVFPGKIVNKEELFSYYKKASVFAMTSRWESFGLVLLEAMSSGCYLVCTDAIPPLEDLIVDENYGIIARTDDVENFADALRKACSQYGQIEPKKIIKYANANWTWDAVCSKLNTLLN
jgi:glycosyltransferase involved in cell wall biosynthesis